MSVRPLGLCQLHLLTRFVLIIFYILVLFLLHYFILRTRPLPNQSASSIAEAESHHLIPDFSCVQQSFIHHARDHRCYSSYGFFGRFGC